MLTYLIIMLDDTSVSICHHEVAEKKHHLIELDVLKRGIVWAMKENLNIQFVYPDYQLPEAHRQAIETIDHTKIGSTACNEELDVVVIKSLKKEATTGKGYLWRCTLRELEDNEAQVKEALDNVARLNIVLTDIPQWKQSEFDAYNQLLEKFADHIAELYKQGKSVQLNLLTDRLMLSSMNNCNAGDTTVTLAPDGRFYLCPAFYPGESIGSLEEGLNIPNKQLYKLDHAPICRACDAFQCKRCVWMNMQTTMDCNTPSHEQCVAAHLERNASRLLQQKLHEQGVRLENSHEIPETEYLDPFNIVNRWK